MNLVFHHPEGDKIMEVFLWLILIWVVALCPPIGFIIGILALLGASIGSCFRR